jgi:hypothetical protein
MSSTTPKRPALTRWARLVLIAAAVRGTCAGAARAFLDYILNLL